MTSMFLVLLVVAAAGWFVQSMLARRSERNAADSAADFSRALAALSPDGDGRGRPRRARRAGSSASMRPRGAVRRPVRRVPARRW